MSDNPYAVDYCPRLTGWQPKPGLDDTQPIRPSTIKHAPTIEGQDYFTLVEASGRKCYGPFDKGRKHNYIACIGSNEDA